MYYHQLVLFQNPIEGMGRVCYVELLFSLYLYKNSLTHQIHDSPEVLRYTNTEAFYHILFLNSRSNLWYDSDT